MMRFEVTKLLFLVIVCGFHGRTTKGLTSRCQKRDANRLIRSIQSIQTKHRGQIDRATIRSLNVLRSTPDPNFPAEDFESSDTSASGPSMSLPTSSTQRQQQQEPETPVAYVPPPPTPTQNAPPVVRQQAMDPLMASLTRDSSNASPDQPTQNVPLFGEIPADGTLLLLAPAVVFAALGFIYSIVIALNSSDQIASSLMQAGDSIAQSAVNRNNKVYDKNACRGLCSSQQEDIDGMRNFMEAITRNAREGK